MRLLVVTSDATLQSWLKLNHSMWLSMRLLVYDSFLMEINYSINPIFAPIGATGHLVFPNSHRFDLPVTNHDTFSAVNT